MNRYMYILITREMHHEKEDDKLQIENNFFD